MEVAGWIAIGIFMVGVIYQAGRHSARLDALEDWKGEVRSEFHDLRDLVKETQALIRGQVE